MRRWYVALPLGIATVIGAFIVRTGVQPGFTVTASALVLPPSSTLVQSGDGSVRVQPVNPFLSFTTSTSTAASALSILASQPAFIDRVTGGEPLSAYLVTVQPREPILNVSIESKNKGQALAVGRQVLSDLSRELERQQAGSGPEQQLTLGVLAEPTVSSVDSSQLRAFAIALAVGLLITLSVAIAVDGAVASNRSGGRRRRGTNKSLPSPAWEASSPSATGVTGSQSEHRERGEEAESSGIPESSRP